LVLGWTRLSWGLSWRQQRSGLVDASEQSSRRDSGRDRSRLLPVLAVERVIRAVLLIGVGLILWTHSHAELDGCRARLGWAGGA
jgi:hypothetical protein